MTYCQATFYGIAVKIPVTALAAVTAQPIIPAFIALKQLYSVLFAELCANLPTRKAKIPLPYPVHVLLHSAFPTVHDTRDLALIT